MHFEPIWFSTVSQLWHRKSVHCNYWGFFLKKEKTKFKCLREFQYKNGSILGYRQALQLIQEKLSSPRKKWSLPLEI